MGYLNESGLARYDGLIKNWTTFKSGTVDGIEPLLNWQRTDTAGAVTCYPLPAAPIDPTVNFAFTETGPASGTKSPDNPSTITGVSQAKVTRCGKNLIPIDKLHMDGAGLTVTADMTAGFVRLSGTSSVDTSIYFRTQNTNNNILSDSAISYGKTYAVSFTGTAPSSGVSLKLYIKTTPSSSWSKQIDIGCGNSSAYLIPDGTYSAMLRLDVASGTSLDCVCYVQIEEGSTATSFEPYAGTDYTIDLGGTYYGGSVDLSAGMMTVTWAGDVVTGTEGYVQGVTSDAIFSYESDARIITNRPFSNCICERFTNGTDLNCFRAFNSGRIRFYVDAVAYPSVESFSSWLASLYASGTPLIMVYQVATPYTVQLTPTQIYSLSQLDPYTPRINTVYSDQQSVQVGYPKSPLATSAELTNAIVSLGGNI